MNTGMTAVSDKTTAAIFRTFRAFRGLRFFYHVHA